jgi:hypothetical protein
MVVVTYATPGMEVKEAAAVVVEACSVPLDETESRLPVGVDAVKKVEVDRELMLNGADEADVLEDGRAGASVGACCGEVVTLLGLAYVDIAFEVAMYVPVLVSKVELLSCNENWGRLVVVVVDEAECVGPFSVVVCGIVDGASEDTF